MQYTINVLSTSNQATYFGSFHWNRAPLAGGNLRELCSYSQVFIALQRERRELSKQVETHLS